MSANLDGDARSSGKTNDKFVPTVFIGLGGSGKAVLMRLRKRFHDQFPTWGNRFDRFARFVFIDTDRGGFTPPNEKESMYADVKPSESELVESPITRQRFQTILQKLEHKADAEDLHWLKSSTLREVGAGATELGAGSHRQFGRLAFFENFVAIQEKIKDQIAGSLAYATDHPGETVTGEVDVVIVTSLAGGTGSGMFLDVAYLVRALLDHFKLRKKHVTLITFLPEMFSDDLGERMPRLRQNAYAALLELEHYASPMTGDALFLGEEIYGGRDGRHGFQAAWPGDRATWPGGGSSTNFFADRGWDTLFLVDNVNILTQSKPLKSAQVFQMTADYLFLDFGQSKFATLKRSVRSNLTHKAVGWKPIFIRRELDPERKSNGGDKGPAIFATRNRCLYSSFGLAEIFFDRDNLYQAAAYRLAHKLVKRRWLGVGGNCADDDLGKWADEDLLRPTAIEGEVKSPTSFHPKTAARRAARGEERDWLADWANELAELDGLADDAAADRLTEIVNKHRAALAQGGEAQLTIAQNAKNWSGSDGVLGEWRERLQELARRRLSTHGVEPTRKLLKAYKQTLIDAREHLASQYAEGNLGGSLLARLAEARTVPFPARQIAVRIELSRARAAADAEMRKQYNHVAGRALRPALAAAIRFIGEPNQTEPDGVVEPLHQWLDRAEEHLKKIDARLVERFEIASRGRDLVDHRKQSLTVLWDKTRYNGKINQALLLYDKVGRDPSRPEGSGVARDGSPFEFHWPALESLVLKKHREVVAEARDAQPAGTNAPPTGSVADLLRYWEQRRLVNSDHVKQIAQNLADACGEVLNEKEAKLLLADYEHGNVADLLQNAESPARRGEMIDRMVMSAAPYLPLSHGPGQAIQPAHHNQFGLSEGTRPTSKDNARKIKDLVAETASKLEPDNVADFGEPLEVDESSALFLRMAVGFPLQDYTRLEYLYKAYADPNSERPQDEAHIDFKQSWEDLPDIRPVAPETYGLIRDNINHVLLSMMIGVITHPPDRGAFYVRKPDRHGAGEDYHRLGKRISRAIKHACDDPEIRRHLADRWESWSRKAGVKDWACLHEAALRAWNESRRDIVIETGDGGSSPFRNCYDGLLKMIGKRLGEIEGGRAWLEALQPRIDDDLGPEDDRPAPARPTGLDAALKPIHEGLKIYQLVQPKVRLVELADADPAAPLA